MVDAYEHNVLAGEVRTVVKRQFTARAHCEPAAVEPNHHRPFLAVVDTLGPNIQELAVIGLNAIIPLIQEGLAVVLPREPGRLMALVSIVQRRLHPLPGIGVLRRHEALRFRVAHALEGVNAILDVPAKGTIAGLYQRIRTIDNNGVLGVIIARGKEQQCRRKG